MVDARPRFMQGGAVLFSCTDFERDSSSPLIAYCKIPCYEQSSDRDLQIVVWGSNRIMRIAEGTFKHLVPD